MVHRHAHEAWTRVRTSDHVRLRLNHTTNQPERSDTPATGRKPSIIDSACCYLASSCSCDLLSLLLLLLWGLLQHRRQLCAQLLPHRVFKAVVVPVLVPEFLFL